jgi:predicted deacylase
MKNFSAKRIAIIGVVLIVFISVGVVAFVGFQKKDPELVPVIQEEIPILQQDVIGSSVQGRDIGSYTYLSADEADGIGQSHLVFIGGVHGGYEYNSVLLAYEFVDYLKENPEIIPHNVTVTIIPNANPDGVYKVVGKEGRFALADVPKGIETSLGRFNANNVDLNRNFDCKWQPESTWRGNSVSAGTAPFSEPEAIAIRNFVEEQKPSAVIFWHSQANTVYASECENGILAETLDIMNAYADAADYQKVESFDAYEITGDAEGWLASIGIPAITVELQTHETIEWERNLAGVKALFKYYK